VSEQTVISFVGTTALKRVLEAWAREADRSVSAELRQILAQEIKRRQQQPAKQKAGTPLAQGLD